MKKRFLWLVVASVVCGQDAAIARESEPGHVERTRLELIDFFVNVDEHSPTLLARVKDDPEWTARMEREIAALDAGELAEIHGALGEARHWQVVPEALFASLPPAVRQRLQDATSLVLQEREDLEAFRSDLAFLFESARLLDPSIEPGQESPVARSQRVNRLLGVVDRLGPEQLREMKQEFEASGAWPEEQLSRVPEEARRRVSNRAGRGAFDDNEKRRLEEFRVLVGTFLSLARQNPSVVGGAAGRLDALATTVDSATTGGLYLAEAMVDRPKLEVATASLQAVAAIESRTNADLAALAAEAQDGPVHAELEVFRADVLSALDDAAAQPFANAEELSEARETMNQATLEELVVRRAVAAQTAPTAGLGSPNPDSSEQGPVSTEPPVALGSPPTAALDLVDIGDCKIDLGSIDVGIDTIPLGSINLNFICDPLEDALNELSDAFVDLIATVGMLVIDAFGLLLDIPIVNGKSLNDLLTPSTLESVLDLAEGYWDFLPISPTDLPCPVDGTMIPHFGEVGDREAARSYTRSLFVFNKILGLIPDSEISLVVKVPLEIAWGGVQYLEICLNQAADRRAFGNTLAFRDSTLTGIADTQLQLGAHDIHISTLLSDLDSDVGNLGDSLSQQILDFETLDVRLQIEGNLLADGKKYISMFQLPMAFGGMLEVVRDVVELTIQANQVAGQRVDKAQKEWEKGNDEFSEGKFKRAYDRYSKAYKEAVKDRDDDSDSG